MLEHDLAQSSFVQAPNLGDSCSHLDIFFIVEAFSALIGFQEEPSRDREASTVFIGIFYLM